MDQQNQNFPNQWICPISKQLMNDPVIAEDGYSYQRAFIENWFRTSNMSPVSGVILTTTNLIPNRALKQTIEQLVQQLQELTLIKKLFEEAMKRQVMIDFQKYPKYGEYLVLYGGKIQFNMGRQSVTDLMVEEITQCNLTRIQVLSLSDNQIADHGFNLLFQNKEWPALQQIWMCKNKIQNIHSLYQIPNLQSLGIEHNELSEASCSYLCEHQWPKLTCLGISFKVGLNDVCWEKLLSVMKEKFPKLNYLSYSLEGDVSSNNQEKIATYCENNLIVLDL